MTLYKNKNRKRLTQKSLEWAKKNRQSRLEIQRKWNNSEKGIRSKRKWYESHISELVQKVLSQFSEDEAFRKVAIARGTSNRRLKASGREYKCEACGAAKKLHCRHKDWNPLNRQDMDSLQWPCIKCHKLVHSEGYGELGRPIVPPANQIDSESFRQK